MESRNDELERFKRVINLVELAASYGYLKDKGKSTRRTWSMKHPNGQKLVISVSPAGHWQYLNPLDDADNGTVIDLVQKLENANLGEVRKILRAWLGESAQRPVPTWKPERVDAAKDRSAVVAYLDKFKSSGKSDYLESRGITQQTLAAPLFAGRVLAGYRGAVIFPHFDKEGVCGYEIKSQGFTSFSEQGFKGLWVSRIPRNVTQLVFCESGIEALSYWQHQQPQNTIMLSTAGSWAPEVGAAMQRLMSRFPTAHVIAGFNNDKGGERQTTKLEALAQEAGAPFKINLAPEKGQDWNDAVQAISARRNEETKP